LDRCKVLRRFDGVTVKRVIDRSGAQVPEHAHDWPLLSLFVLGSYRNRTELGETFIAGPSAVFYRAGAAHQNSVASRGFEQVEIEFDPAWLGRDALPDAPVTRWLGGQSAARGRALLRACSTVVSGGQLREAVRGFLGQARAASERPPPPWVGTVAERLTEERSPSVSALAREVERHPAWLGTAYRQATGERISETLARHRVERAAQLLRESDRPAALIALEAGFCDQSHMSRTFRRLLGRSPSSVRAERATIRTGPDAQALAYARSSSAT
jgi:AraC-like DNA-binding protein